MRNQLKIICSVALVVGVFSSCESCLSDLKVDYETLRQLWFDYQTRENFTEDFLKLAKNLLYTYDDCYVEHAYTY